DTVHRGRIAMKIRTRIAQAATVLMLAAGGVTIAMGTAHASPPCSGSPSVNKVLQSGSTWPAATYFCSGNYEFANQANGDIVIYRADGTPIWHSNTDTGLASYATMQTDGNFVQARSGWSTRTSGHPGAYMCFQRDGNMVVYAVGGGTCAGRALWATGT